MDLAQLRQAVVATDKAAVLVSPRILRRVLRAEYGLPYLLFRVPHDRCYFFDRQVLFRHLEQDELELEPDRLLPTTVILLALPSPQQLQEQGGETILARYWRLLFHAHVHVALDRLRQEGRLTPADVRARVEQIGPTEFGEIRTVLEQERAVLPPADDLTVYVEFVALYLELRHFRANLLQTYFPALRDFFALDALLARDVDAEALFARTRLPGAPDPVVRTDTSSDESHDYYWKLLRVAERAAADGDIVRAAVLRTKAARVAPPDLAQDTRGEALRDLVALTGQLKDALKFSPDEAAEWQQVLPALLEKADQGNWPVEAKLLYDLQKICQEHKQKLYALDLVEWALSGGRRPIRRPLNSLQVVHDTNHLRGASQRLTMARVSDEDRQRLGRLLQAALHQSEVRLRERIRPMLQDAFYDVGLVADSPPAEVALQKMIEELLDRIRENGFFTFSDLRDTISGNQLKLPDLTDPHSFWRGDQLLRLDRRLSTPMEGVYRPAEFYLRWLESCSSLFFGTGVGRFLTRNLLVPFGGALLLVRGLTFLWNHSTHHDVSLPDLTFLPLGVFLLGLMYVEQMRVFFHDTGAHAFRGLRVAFVDTPARLWRLPWLQHALRSWPFLLLFWYVLKPLGVFALLVLFWPDPFWSPGVGLVTFLAVDLLLNSRIATALGDAFAGAFAVLYDWLRFDALQGLVRIVSWFFKQVTEAVESVLYTADEWFRFRTDETRFAMAARAALGVVWFPVRYLVRLYFIMLIEPSLNPLKLPIGILAAKFFVLIPNYVAVMQPGSEVQQSLINEQLGPHTGVVLAVLIVYLFIVPTLWLLPSAVAWIIWEMKANWRLFRANRPNWLRPVVVGRHGETVLQLLKPGTHSGTIPRLFAHLRRAERTAYLTINWREARTYRQALGEVARSVQVFVEREFVALLHHSKRWPNRPLRVAQVVLSCTLIRIELAHAHYPKESVWLALEERSGWLIGSLEEAGWLRHLTAPQRGDLTAALGGLYKLCGVDFVREQLAGVLPPSGYRLTDQQLLVWTDRPDGSAIAYELRGRDDLLSPHVLNDIAPASAPALAARKLFYSRAPLTWEQWVRCWRPDENGEVRPALFGDSVQLLPAEAPAK